MSARIGEGQPIEKFVTLAMRREGGEGDKQWMVVAGLDFGERHGNKIHFDPEQPGWRRTGIFPLSRHFRR